MLRLRANEEVAPPSLFRRMTSAVPPFSTKGPSGRSENGLICPTAVPIAVVVDEPLVAITLVHSVSVSGGGSMPKPNQYPLLVPAAAVGLGESLAHSLTAHEFTK